MNRWDIYWADVPFEDEPSQIKRRPVIIAKDKTAYVLTLKVTSKEPKSDTDYPLLHWEEAGLTAPSVVRVSKVSKLSQEDFGDRIGRLNIEDIAAIMSIMKRIKATINRS